MQLSSLSTAHGCHSSNRPRQMTKTVLFQQGSVFRKKDMPKISWAYDSTNAGEREESLKSM